MAKNPKPKGRPTDFTAAIGDAICQRLSEGESLRSICRDERMPAESTVRKWAIEDREGFSAQYTRARDIGLDCRAERIGERIEMEADTQRARLLFDHERWYLSKLAPKRYGDKVAHVGGADDDPPIKAAVTVKLVRSRD